MVAKLYYRGTIVKVKNKRSYTGEARAYMLVDNLSDEYWFQLVCVVGYDSGNIYGYIKADEYARELGCRGVTREHLIKELQEERNLGEIYKSTLRIKPEPKDIIW